MNESSPPNPHIWPIVVLMAALLIAPGCIDDPESFSAQNNSDFDVDGGFDTDSESPDANSVPPNSDRQCPSGYEFCQSAADGEGLCISTADNPEHCGMCDNICEASPHGDAICEAGSCEIRCHNGFAMCHDGCIPITDNPAHCGICGNECPSGICEGGQCQPFACDPLAEPFGGGSGLLTDPYTICSAQQFVRIAHEPPHAFYHYALSDDIDLHQLGDGSAFSIIDNFYATFDGHGFAIRNIEFAADQVVAGVFGTLHPSAAILNLTLENLSASNASQEEHNRLGGLVGTNLGLIADVEVQGAIQGFDAVGGIAGYNHGLIQDSSTDASMVGQNWAVGSIVGYHFGHLENTESSGTVTTTRAAPGGLVGHQFPGATITDSISHADVTVQPSGEDDEPDGYGRAGGLVGYCEGCVITDSAGHGNIDSVQPFAGGLVGLSQEHARIERSHATGTVHSSSGVAGGLIGGAHGQTEVIESWATGDVHSEGTTFVGGLIGSLAHDAQVHRSFATGDVHGGFRVGGLVGHHQHPGAAVHDCYATGDVTANGNSVGGLIGRLGGAVHRCYSTGFVHPEGESIDTGGLVGFVHGDDIENASVSHSFWDIETSGQAESAGGEGLQTAQFSTVDHFVQWEFPEVWIMPDPADLPESEPPRPRLQWEFEPQ